MSKPSDKPSTQYINMGDSPQDAPLWATLGDARKEDSEWEELDEVKRNNDKRWLACYGRVLIWITLVFTVIFLLALGSWVLHYLISPKYHWLEEYQLSKIQSVLFSGGMGAIVSGIIRSQLAKTR